MKTNSVHCMVFCGLLLAAVAAHAQNLGLADQFHATTPLQRAEAQTEVLADVLQLSPEQTGELVEINLKYSKKIQRLINQGASDAILYHEIQKYSQAKDEEIDELLTNEQAERYAEYKAKLRRIIEDVIQRRNR